MSEHVLIIFPHPDDEAFSCTGLVRSYIEKGVPVTYICLTLGEMARNMGNPIIANRETLPLIRKKELEEACRVIGIQDLRLWGLRDKTIEFEIDLTDRIHQTILEINPSLIISFYPGYSVHPDHDACGAAVVKAIKQMPAASRPLFYGVGFAPNIVADLGKPDIVFDVTRYKDIKMAVLQAHASQSEGMLVRVTKLQDPIVLKRLEHELFWKIDVQ